MHRRRIMRALEVFEATGTRISEWRRRTPRPAFDARLIVLNWNREELYRRIDARFDAMMNAGFADEVRGLLSRGLSPDLPSLATPGYREIIAALSGRCTIANAVDRAKRATRHYAKRQLTWFRREKDAEWVAWG
jgi:tRNA dimethylallyltransferase